MGKRVVIDSDECIGCESCVELCSEVFVFNEAEEIAESKQFFKTNLPR
jgi:ferredoxin